MAKKKEKKAGKRMKKSGRGREWGKRKQRTGEE